MARTSNWSDDYWLLLLQLYLRKPVGIKPMYSRAMVELAMELHIAPQILFSRMGQLAALQARLEAVREKEKLRYDTGRLAEDIRRQVESILSGETDSEVFYKNILDQMIVYRDGKVEVRLNLLPMKWAFVLERMARIQRQLQEENAPENPVCNSEWEMSGKSEVEKNEENQGSEAPVCKRGYSVPMSVSNPFSSG